MLALQNAPVGSLEIRGLRLRPVPRAGTTASSTLAQPGRAGGRARRHGRARHRPVRRPTIERLVLQYERLLATALAAPDLPVAELALLEPVRAAQVLLEWNDTADRGAPEVCLHPERRRAGRADAIGAVAVELGAERWTYRRLVGSARRLARHLRTLGVGPDDRVGLCAERSPALVAGMLGVLEAGGAWLPLDPAYPAERLASCSTIRAPGSC